MAEFVFKTREEFKKHLKLCGNEPRNYKILEEQPNTRELTTAPEEQPNTQYLKIQNPTTPEEAQPPTPTEKEAIKMLTGFFR